MRRSLFLAMSVLLVAACSDDPTEPDVSHRGTYQLQSVNGEAVPVSFEEGEETITVSEGSLNLDADGTFDIEIEMSFTVGDVTTPETVSLSGDYTRTGNTLTFDHDDDGFQTATVSGDVVTTAGGGGEVIVFERQD